MNHILRIILFSAWLTTGSAHAMDSADQKTIVKLHQKLNVLVTSGKNPITVRTLVNGRDVQLPEQEAQQFVTDLLSTLKSVKQHDDGSIEIIDCSSHTSSPASSPLRTSSTHTLSSQLQTTSKPSNVIVPIAACVACLGVGYYIARSLDK